MRRAALFFAIVLAIAVWRPHPAAAEVPAAGPPITLRGGAPSIEALLAEFLAALERRDTAALHRLRVSKEEYDEIVIPGFVAIGEAPRRVSERPREVFWALNDRKSRYAAEAIVERYGGRHYAGHTLRLTHGTAAYAWYSAHGEVRLDLRSPEHPGIVELRTGTIVEVGGRFKFIGFQWDD